MKGICLAAAALAVIIAGCGGENGPSDEDQVRSQVETFTSAMAKGDQGAACETLTVLLRSSFDFGSGYGCDKSLGPIGNLEDWTGLQSEIEVSGTTATVQFADLSARREAAQRTYGDWLDCDLLGTCSGELEEYRAGVTPESLSMVKVGDEWLISGFEVDQPG